MKVYVSRTYEPERVGVARCSGTDKPYCIIYSTDADDLDEWFTVRLDPTNPNHCERVRELARLMGVAVVEADSDEA